jgi:hypothetical protein
MTSLNSLPCSPLPFGRHSTECIYEVSKEGRDDNGSNSRVIISGPPDGSLVSSPVRSTKPWHPNAESRSVATFDASLASGDAVEPEPLRLQPD